MATSYFSCVCVCVCVWMLVGFTSMESVVTQSLRPYQNTQQKTRSEFLSYNNIMRDSVTVIRL